MKEIFSTCFVFLCKYVCVCAWVSGERRYSEARQTPGSHTVEPSMTPVILAALVQRHKCKIIHPLLYVKIKNCCCDRRDLLHRPKVPCKCAPEKSWSAYGSVVLIIFLYWLDIPRAVIVQAKEDLIQQLDCAEDTHLPHVFENVSQS